MRWEIRISTYKQFYNLYFVSINSYMAVIEDIHISLQWKAHGTDTYIQKKSTCTTYIEQYILKAIKNATKH